MTGSPRHPSRTFIARLTPPVARRRRRSRRGHRVPRGHRRTGALKTPPRPPSGPGNKPNLPTPEKGFPQCRPIRLKPPTRKRPGQQRTPIPPLARPPPAAWRCHSAMGQHGSTSRSRATGPIPYSTVTVASPPTRFRQPHPAVMFAGAGGAPGCARHTSARPVISMLRSLRPRRPRRPRRPISRVSRNHRTHAAVGLVPPSASGMSSARPRGVNSALRPTNARSPVAHG